MLTILLALAAIVVVPVTAALAFRALRRQRIARDLGIDSPQGVVEERFVPIGGVGSCALAGGPCAASWADRFSPWGPPPLAPGR